jgi:hypothetical protein
MTTEEKDKIRQQQKKLFNGSDQDAYDAYLTARFGKKEAANYRVVD